MVEIFIIILFGFLPLFALALRNSTQTSDGNITTIADTIEGAFNGGQLYLYVFSIFGTLMWLALFDWTHIYTKFRIFLMFCIVLLGFFIFGLANFDPTFSEFGKVDQWVVSTSYWSFLFSVILYWLLLFSRKPDVPTPKNALTKGADNMAKDFEELG
jgi:hypothetical protein